MCRFIFYLGPPLRISTLVTDPRNSLIHQSFAAEYRAETLNGDGFGLAWRSSSYPEPGLFRSLTPAWSNANLRHLSRVTQSDCFLAHVRAASFGLEVSQANCHPFTRGRFSFMHNGEIGAFHKIRRRLFALLSDDSFDSLRGSTDSEVFFALFMDNVGGVEAQPDAPQMAVALKTTMNQVLAVVHEFSPDSCSYFNFVISTGDHAVASRVVDGPPEKAMSLFLSCGKSYRCVEGQLYCQVAEESEPSFLVCSEPLSQNDDWQEVPANHFVLLSRNDDAVIQDWQDFV